MRTSQRCIARLVFVVLLTTLLAGCGGKQLEIGMDAPDFAATSIAGKDVNLDALLKRGPVVLVLVRGFGDRDTRRQLDSLKADKHRFDYYKASIVVVARTRTTNQVFRFWDSYKRYMLGISDRPEKKIGTAYRQEWKLTGSGLQPALFVIHTNGKLAWTHYGKKPYDIPKNEDVLKILDMLQ